MKFNCYRNPGLRLIHLQDGDRTVCKHYRIFKMEQAFDVDSSGDPLCTDCHSALLTRLRKEQDESVA